MLLLLLLLDVFIRVEEEEKTLEGSDKEDGDGMMLQTGVDGWTLTSTAACSKQLE